MEEESNALEHRKQDHDYIYIGGGHLRRRGIQLVSGQIKNEENEKWVAHTFEVLQNLDLVLSSLTDAETGERGYVLTGTATYLEPYNQVRKSERGR